MSELSFKEFFQQAIGHAPYDYQRRLEGFDTIGSCDLDRVSVSISLGKTAVIIISWFRNHFEKLIQFVAANRTKYPAVCSAIFCRTGICRGQQATFLYRNLN